MTATSTDRRSEGGTGARSDSPAGFTLLEVLMVVAIMGFIAAMIYPAMGYFNDRERARITQKRMEEIRRALVGDPDRFDEQGRRIIGGYVGDLEAWPDLYEAAPQVKESVVGDPPAFDAETANNRNYYYYRPGGHFTGKRWGWNHPYRKLSDAASDGDHIGGVRTENEGQPLGLWTDDPTGDGAGRLDATRWKGPYLVPPTDRKPENAVHLAESDEDYAALEPVYDSLLGVETWEDGDYDPDDFDPGEYYDDKEKFRLLQTDNRLADGWHRALRFFISDDPDHEGETIFWMLSEGPDAEGTYPTKGICNLTAWTVNGEDTMSREYDPAHPELGGYNPDDPYNQDNIVMKIHSTEWRAVFYERNLRKKQATEGLFAAIRRALVGNATPSEGGFDSGFTGALCRWPGLFQWEDAGTPGDATDDYWDDENGDSPAVAYTKGQPRGLWTDRPNSADSADNLAAPSWSSPGIGWRGAFMPPPFGSGADAKLLDAWGREVLFFLDTANDALLVLSRGPDGRFDFGDTDTLPAGAPDGTDDYLEPGTPTETVDVSTYNPVGTGGCNADNVTMVIDGSNWQPGWFRMRIFTVENAVAGVTKARFYYGYDSAAGSPLSVIYVAGATGTWSVGDAFDFSDLSAEVACAGARRLVAWNDGDGDGVVDVGEAQATVDYNIFTHNGLEPRDDLTLNTATFTPAP